MERVEGERVDKTEFNNGCITADKHEDECMESTTRVLKCGGQNTGEYVCRSIMGSKLITKLENRCK